MNKKIVTLLLGTALTVSALAGCQNADLAEAPAQDKSTTASNSSAGNSQSPQNSNSVNRSSARTQNGISADEAKTIALNQAGVSETDALAVTVLQDFDDGFSLYDVDIYTPDIDYDYEINTADGTILKQDMKYTDKVANIQSQTSITPEQAQNTVLQKVSGATEKNLRMKLDFDDGRYSYEGEIIYNGMAYDFDMDAETGTIYGWEQETLQY
ncbi:PepSY domain-containing protein [Mediterraneibacter sp. NSJ-55]|uniref:PepSY domain-containing protein n=1 Tax=Mediterraneibacter hominis TaxID=2763054 RepID=A0A923LL72_9FIRM|nr:PepSY domain-containing protein [Mediterraneibacter hominis]MBC5689976.1 PepSY domain-containing protein [Mediterraneibacter hominis]